MFVIFLQSTHCIKKTLIVSCTLLRETGDGVKVDQSSFSADLHAVMFVITARSLGVFYLSCSRWISEEYRFTTHRPIPSLPVIILPLFVIFLYIIYLYIFIFIYFHFFHRCCTSALKIYLTNSSVTVLCPHHSFVY